MPGSASLFHMHPLLESDCAILTYILQFFALCRSPKSGASTLNTLLDVRVLMVTAY